MKRVFITIIGLLFIGTTAFAQDKKKEEEKGYTFKITKEIIVIKVILIKITIKNLLK